MPAKKPIDPTEVRKLAMIGATLEEIARYLGLLQLDAPPFCWQYRYWLL